MPKLRRTDDEVMTILWSTYDFSKIGPQASISSSPAHCVRMVP